MYLNVINVEIKNKKAVRTNETAYVCDNSNFIVVFSFDEEWDAFPTKTARFIYNGKYQDVIFSGTECPMPIISNTKLISVGVFAGDLYTSTPALIVANKSILCGEGVPDVPSENVYNQIVDLFNQAMTAANNVGVQLGDILLLNTTNKSNIVESVNEVNGGLADVQTNIADLTMTIGDTSKLPDYIETIVDSLIQNDVAHEMIVTEHMGLSETVSENKNLLKTLDEDVGFIWEAIGDKVQYDDKITANSVYEAIYDNTCSIEQAEANISEVSNKVAKLNTDILKWQLLCEETLTEDAVYMYDLTDGGKRKCKGALYNAITPKGANLPGMMLQVLDKNRITLSQAYTWADNTNTNIDKIRRICCKPENGYYTTYYGTSTSHQNYITRLNEISTYINYKRDTIYLGQIGSSVELPAGTIIKIWGLIEE